MNRVLTLVGVGMVSHIPASIQLLSKKNLDSDFRHNYLHTPVGYTWSLCA